MVNKKCDGNRQSPIDITGDTPLNGTLKKLELAENWNTTKLTGSQKFTLKNKGYTVQLDIKGTEIMTKQNGKTSHEQPLTGKQQSFFSQGFSSNKWW